MYKAVALGALQDLHDFFARCRTGLFGLDGVGRHVADGNAHILFQMAAALAADPAGTAAGAGADCTLAVVLIQPVRQMLQIDRFLFRWDCFFDRDDVMPMPAPPGSTMGVIFSSGRRDIRSNIVATSGCAVTVSRFIFIYSALPGTNMGSTYCL